MTKTISKIGNSQGIIFDAALMDLARRIVVLSGFDEGRMKQVALDLGAHRHDLGAGDPAHRLRRLLYRRVGGLGEARARLGPVELLEPVRLRPAALIPDEAEVGGARRADSAAGPPRQGSGIHG